MYRSIRLTFLLLTLCRVCVSQDYLSEVQKATKFIKSIPRTNTISAPEFDVQIGYIARFDSSSNSLLIRCNKQDPVTGAFHFDQELWEVPLNELTKESFFFEEDTDDDGNPVFKFRIIHPGNSPKFTHYWMRENRIAFVNVRDDVYFGPWNRNAETLSAINQLKLLLTNAADSNPNKRKDLVNVKPDTHARPTITMKFQDKIVTTIGFSKDPDPSLPDGYYMAQSVDFVPLLSGTKDEVGSLGKLNKQIKKFIRENHATLLPSTWVMVSIDADGITQRLQVIPSNEKEENVSISRLSNDLKWVPGRYKSENVKTKYFVTTE